MSALPFTSRQARPARRETAASGVRPRWQRSLKAALRTALRTTLQTTLQKALQKALQIALLALLALAATPALAGLLVPKDANNLVIQELVVSDLAHLGTLVGDDPGRPIPWSGYVTDTDWAVTSSTPYRDGTLGLHYRGQYDPVLDVVTWTGRLEFTNAVGTVAWDSEGSYTDATKDGFWKWLKKAAKTIAQHSTLINFITEGLQAVATVATAGAAGAPAVMISQVVSTVVAAAQITTAAIEVVNVVKDLSGNMTASTTRAPALPPAGFAAPDLVLAEPSYIEVVSKSLIQGNYQQAVVYVAGSAQVNSTLCLNAAFPVTMDTYVRGAPATDRAFNFGKQEYVAAGSGSPTSQDVQAYLKFDIPAAFAGHAPASSLLSLTVQGYEGGSAATVHPLRLWMVAGAFPMWIEGNGYLGDLALAPPGAVHPAAAFGLNYNTRPGFESELSVPLTITQGSTPRGSVVRVNIGRTLLKGWLDGQPDQGIVINGGVLGAAVRFGAREGPQYKLPGWAAAPTLSASWYDRGDFNADGVIDSQDVNDVLRHIGPSTAANQAYDLDRNGKVTVLDARKLARCCALPNCAKP